MLRLGVNVDHVATIRNARGGRLPDPLEAARIAIAAGADGITIHLREDRRHIRDDDVRRIRAGISAPLNFEHAVTDEMLAMAREVRPHACCLVPERREEVTTEGGLDAAGKVDTLRPFVAALAAAGCRVSLFIDPDEKQLQAAAAVAAPVVELHTGSYAHTGGAERIKELERLKRAATRAKSLGIECHAGHGLDFENVGAIAAIPELVELNIGHFLVAESVFGGLAAAVRTMKHLMIRHRGGV